LLGVDPSILDTVGLVGVRAEPAPAVFLVFLVITFEPLDGHTLLRGRSYVVQPDAMLNWENSG
jgi:hypothetical protein